MALDWTSLGSYKFDLRPRTSGVGQAAGLGANSVVAVPSGTFAGLSTLGFPMHIPTSCAGLVAFGFGPRDGTSVVQGPSMASSSVAVPTTNPQSCTIAVLAEITGSKPSTSAPSRTSGLNNQALYSWASGSSNRGGASIGIDRTIRFTDGGTAPGSGDWWNWVASSLRMPCNLQLVVIRRNGTSVTINTAADVSEVLTTSDAITTSSGYFVAGSMEGNNVAVGKIARWTVWDGQLSDGNVTSLFNDVYASGGLAPNEYTGDIVVFGSSTSAGAYGLPGQNWVDHLLYAAHAAKKRVWNYSRSGEFINGGLRTTLSSAITDTTYGTLNQDYLKFLFGNNGENFPARAKVVIMHGANDISFIGGSGGTLTGAQICLGLQAACQLLKSWGATIYAVAPTPVRVSSWTSTAGLNTETARQGLVTAMQALVGNEIDAAMTWDGTDFEPTATTDAAAQAVTTGPNYQLQLANDSNLMATSNDSDGIHPGPIGQRVQGGAITRFVMQRIIAAEIGSPIRARNRGRFG